MTSEEITASAEVVTAIFTALAVAVAWFQLSGIKKSMDMSALMALLAIEADMKERKKDFDAASAKIREAKQQKQEPAKVQSLGVEFDSAKENYSNVLDRLSSCILRGYLKNNELRSDYRKPLQNVIERFPDDFNEASPFRNIKKLNDKWQDE